MNEEILKIVLNDKSFSKDESVSIVGGLRRFTELRHLLLRMEDGGVMLMMF